jgi:hypothetical protein
MRANPAAARAWQLNSTGKLGRSDQFGRQASIAPALMKLQSRIGFNLTIKGYCGRTDLCRFA